MATTGFLTVFAADGVATFERVMADFFLALCVRRACIFALRSVFSPAGISFLAVTTGTAAGLTATVFIGVTIFDDLATTFGEVLFYLTACLAGATIFEVVAAGLDTTAFVVSWAATCFGATLVTLAATTGYVLVAVTSGFLTSSSLTYFLSSLIFELRKV